MRSEEYWAARAAAIEAECQEYAGDAAERIIRLYETAIDDINSSIRGIFAEYVRTSGIDEAKARELLAHAEQDKQYGELMALLEAAETDEEAAEYAARINAQAYGARMTRLEGVKQRIYIEMKKAGAAEKAIIAKAAEKVINTAYYTTIYDTAKGFNYGVDFALLPKRTIKQLSEAQWLGSNYSSRVWKNNADFIKTLQDTIERGIAGQMTIDQMAQRLEDFATATDGKSVRYVTERLVRSEVGHFREEGRVTAYEEAGAEKYTFLAALSERTCDVCGSLDGRTFNIAERIPGVNAPIIHPNCRCVTVIGDFNIGARRARDPAKSFWKDGQFIEGESYIVNGNVTFEQWKAGLSPEQKQAMETHVKEYSQNRNERGKKKTVDKSGGSGIMSMRGDDVLEYIRLGHIDTSLLEKEFGKIQTSDTIITNERTDHIKEQHPEDYELFEKYAKDIIQNPESIIKDGKNAGTVFMAKRLPSTNMNVVLRLALSSDKSGLKNSVMTAYRIRDKNLAKLERKNKVLYKKE